MMRVPRAVEVVERVVAVDARRCDRVSVLCMFPMTVLT